jgi:hypothetical protein
VLSEQEADSNSGAGVSAVLRHHVQSLTKRPITFLLSLSDAPASWQVRNTLLYCAATIYLKTLFNVIFFRISWWKGLNLGLTSSNMLCSVLLRWSACVMGDMPSSRPRISLSYCLGKRVEISININCILTLGVIILILLLMPQTSLRKFHYLQHATEEKSCSTRCPVQRLCFASYVDNGRYF